MSDQNIDRSKLPIRRPPFRGVAEQTLGGSEPDWGLIGHATPPDGAPNVLVVLIDDAGFGNPSTFGGPIDTPNYDRIAGQGLRYNRFHVTAMCSPTRAALLTGRNHHAVGMGGIPEFSGGFPGYSAMLPRDAAPFPKVLKENGYSTAAIGKWNLTPEKEQGPAGPFHHWPNAWGFDYYWGFLAPEAGQYDTMIAENQRFIGVHDGKDGQPFYFPEAMTDQAIDWLHGVRGHDSDKPWMLYYSTGCSHAPHHVAKEWSDKYKGRFDQGWDQLREETFARQKSLGVVPSEAQLTPRPEEMPAWDSLSENSKRLFAHQMEVYAGYSENADHHVGRLLAAIEEMGELDNTVVVWIWGDNGASLKGTPTGTFNEGTMVNGLPLTHEEQMQLTLKWGGLEAWGTEMMYPHHSTAWAWAGNTPFAWGKQVPSPLGGTRDPLVIRWPERISEAAEIRTQCTHVTDIGPTILDIAQIPQPDTVDGIKQQPMTGASFAESLSDPNIPDRHTQQYFENFGNRAMYQDGWWLSMKMPRLSMAPRPSSVEVFRAGGLEPRRGPGRAVLPPRRLPPGHRSGSRAPGEGQGAAGALLGKGRGVPHQAVAGWVRRLLRHAAASGDTDQDDLLRGRPERCGRPGPAHLQPLLHDQRRSPHPRRGRRRRHRRRCQPPGWLLAVRPGWEAQAHLRVPGRVRVQAGFRLRPAERGRERRDDLRRGTRP